ncbi:hypothetical protein THRCLA_06558 [Thraustotheca clavata]|uniref:WRKY19-like zinc finger domain-containing protein n=1 Tax=Thraustotheca clavata TaxID=74557 RepID=A0A1V9ZNG0_9STRA|nr:hypothetical protein THRCLA_06558 [Thraustotheca clavata]
MCRPMEAAVPLVGSFSRLQQGYANNGNMYQTMNKPSMMDMTQMGMPPPFMMMNQKPQYEISTKPEPMELAPASMEDVDVGSFDDLLDCAILDDEKDDVDFNVEEDFDNSEMSILYSFLMDKSEEMPEKLRANSLDGTDDGVMTLNLLDSSPLDTLLDMTSEEECDLSEIELKPPTEFMHQQAPLDLLNDLHDTHTTSKSRRLCKMDGCEKRSRSHGLCIAHGGGRRCAVEGCDKSSQGGNLCIKHGGGKRCEVQGCDKAAQSNMLCKAHGGGPRCLFSGCNRSSQGGGFCRSHGGGKRCLFEGCDKGTQRGDFCALHGGSRLCGVSGCMRNDRGGGFCATHGGGKRCGFDGCLKPCRRKGLCSAHLRLSGEV